MHDRTLNKEMAVVIVPGECDNKSDNSNGNGNRINNICKKQMMLLSWKENKNRQEVKITHNYI